jgi:hypothetical protein
MVESRKVGLLLLVGDNIIGSISNSPDNKQYLFHLIVNSLTAIDGHDRQYFNELHSTVVSRRIFIRSQSLIAR